MPASRKRLFFVLWIAGIAGVASFLWVDLAALIAAFPRPPGEPAPDLPPLAVLKLLSFLQAAVLTSIAVAIGMWLSPAVGLHAPAAEAFAERKPIWPALKPQIAPGILAGLAGGIAIVLTWLIAKPFLEDEFVRRAQEFNAMLPHAVRFLYGGFTEEILLRWGLMTFLVWLFWKISAGLRNDAGQPPGAPHFTAAVLVSAIAFGAGHLPVASLLAGGLTLPLVIYVVIANAVFGIAAGFLYWRRGLESAILAHLFTHVVLIAAIYTEL
jgi:hypothetical protein